VRSSRLFATIGPYRGQDSIQQQEGFFVHVIRLGAARGHAIEEAALAGVHGSRDRHALDREPLRISAGARSIEAGHGVSDEVVGVGQPIASIAAIDDLPALVDAAAVVEGRDGGIGDVACAAFVADPDGRAREDQAVRGRGGFGVELRLIGAAGEGAEAGALARGQQAFDRPQFAQDPAIR
jgi:hypothetical protein